MKVSMVFAKIVDLGVALGWKSIRDLPGCQEHQIDDQWWFAINPHLNRVTCSTGVEVPPCTVYFQFNGFPAGLLNATGGMLAAGEIANEDALMAALNAAIERLKAA